LDIHVLDRVESGPKPELVRALGATYHTGSARDVGFEPDVIVECTGVGPVITDAMHILAAGGVLCLTGVGRGGSTALAPSADVGAAMVLKNTAIVGSVNANRRHWYRAADCLARTDQSWLRRLISRSESPGNFLRALKRDRDDIKVILQFADV
jgi:threonine dehydrogenase-like Zn-dependent dehydrogenase